MCLVISNSWTNTCFHCVSICRSLSHHFLPGLLLSLDEMVFRVIVGCGQAQSVQIGWRMGRDPVGGFHGDAQEWFKGAGERACWVWIRVFPGFFGCCCVVLLSLALVTSNLDAKTRDKLRWREPRLMRPKRLERLEYRGLNALEGDTGYLGEVAEKESGVASVIKTASACRCQSGDG